ncbi:Lcl C-terminal domain-containing protein [Sulfurimonas sp.]
MKVFFIFAFILNGFFLYANDVLQEKQSVIDTKHHLQWQDDTSRDELKWKLAKGYCKQLKLGGYNDWRLPSKTELSVLAKSKNMKKHFKFLETQIYWTSNEDISDNLNAITIYTGNGFASTSDKCDKNFFICVRMYKK